MYAMIAVGAAMLVWTTVLVWTDRRTAVQVIDAVEEECRPSVDRKSGKCDDINQRACGV